MNRLFFLILPALFIFELSGAQNHKSPVIQSVKESSKKQQHDKLFLEIEKADSLVFAAFNTCDTINYRQYFKNDLEFYHDLGGLTIGIDNEMKSIREMCARGNHIRRELMKETLEVHPLKGYGAVEIGVHRFYHTNKGQSETLSGEYKFVQVWQFADGLWKIARVISYGHDVVNND